MKKTTESSIAKSCPLEKAHLLKTLIVEDDADFRQLLKEILINHFPCMQIEEAASNRQALQKIDQCTPRLIFMDTTMIDGSSMPSIAKIKKAHPETVVIALALYTIKEYEDAALQSGADYFLVKSSMTSGTLVQLVASIMPALNRPAAGRHIAERQFHV
jgi:DNA-binding NarL/FixJ family response regulator